MIRFVKKLSEAYLKPTFWAIFYLRSHNLILFNTKSKVWELNTFYLFPVFSEKYNLIRCQTFFSNTQVLGWKLFKKLDRTWIWINHVVNHRILRRSIPNLTKIHLHRSPLNTASLLLYPLSLFFLQKDRCWTPAHFWLVHFNILNNKYFLYNKYWINFSIDISMNE